MLFTKIKAAAIALAVVLVGALGAWAGDFDWGTFGPLGPVVGGLVVWVVAYLTRELHGYGLGVPKPGGDDLLDEGQPSD